ncbi:hypothetical protein ACQUSR_17025 [Streptomyces sp. P1-3]|uniref:hypothetical protein n=1 Tax=Streptomyces sp. P1-3 TaxID=3421658 RepID=UPI003D368CAF
MGAPGYGYAAAPVQPTCRICGAHPAVDVKFRQHQGLLIATRSMSLEGPFCRNCGTATFREMTAKSLGQGWWSPHSMVFFNPFTIVCNLVANAKIKKLPVPVPGQPGAQLDPGKPIRRRAVAYVPLLPLVFWAVMLAAIFLS